MDETKKKKKNAVERLSVPISLADYWLWIHDPEAFWRRFPSPRTGLKYYLPRNRRRMSKFPEAAYHAWVIHYNLLSPREEDRKWGEARLFDAWNEGRSDVLRALGDYAEALKTDKAFLTTKKIFDDTQGGKRKWSWKHIRETYWPDYAGTPQNFQKFLRQRGLLFKPAGKWHVRERVPKSRKNTRSRKKMG